MPDGNIITIDDRRFHLDRRSDKLIEYGVQAGSPDDLLTTDELSQWLQVSRQWCEIGRHRSYGPPFCKIAGRIRYRRSDVVTWLDQRVHRSVAEYRRNHQQVAKAQASEEAPRPMRRRDGRPAPGASE